MAEVANNKVSNADAAKAWIKANPAVLDQWLDGVKTVDGKDALPAGESRSSKHYSNVGGGLLPWRSAGKPVSPYQQAPRHISRVATDTLAQTLQPS